MSSELRDPLSQARQDGVSGGQLQWAQRDRAQGHRRRIGDLCIDPRLLHQVRDAVEPDLARQPHGGHVLGAHQGFPQRDLAFEGAVEVLGLPPMAAIEGHTQGLVQEVVAEAAPSDETRILCVGQADSRGVRKGEIVDFDAAHEALRDAIADAESKSDVTIRSAYVGITGPGADALSVFDFNLATAKAGASLYGQSD